MKAIYKLNDNLSIEIETNSTKELIDELTKIEELRNEPCGYCKGIDVFLRAKTVGDNEFYGMECRNEKCRAVLNFGVKKGKVQNVYKKRVEVDDEGKGVKVDGKYKFIGEKGWVKWNPEKGIAE